MAGEHDEVDLEQVRAAWDLDVVEQQPIVRGVVSQVRDDPSFGVIDGASATDDLSHLSLPPL
ncbi:hypothetical protein Psi02_63370 [Planotetraspora silvatica]|uniref:Uncharacterized protein n=1 Tax=Planotetraspora silvatica TaxID=234614 RepID=A0A8J3URB5_9ACTN|nr:hypothetical protein Psi02_63370 [Planotetraspora silvatica]